ncbi:hypothetical protein TWF694_005243 [Orbilia ellipsospora]|uniref:Uncharacterized protein n=1 Tax=Orbilia ellipsospora TaxID=2528407 RepID=A0AAV9WU45_9PEZI
MGDPATASDSEAPFYTPPTWGSEEEEEEGGPSNPVTDKVLLHQLRQEKVNLKAQVEDFGARALQWKLKYKSSEAGHLGVESEMDEAKEMVVQKKKARSH